MSKEIILTGLRPNNEYHLGNYIGALLPLINLIKNKGDQVDCQIHLFIPDLHSFTTPIDFTFLNDQITTNLKLFTACGIPLNQENIHLYRQSHIPAHSELTWILSNFSSFGELSRMVEFKEKSQRLKREDQISVGLFTYPILMAADILLYDAKWVPVGDDQRQHLEFCRKLARSFNQLFKQDIFTIPADYKQQQAYFNRTEAPRIRSLKHPHQKMSKSIVDPGGTILLSDSEETIKNKIMSATTDNVGIINYNWQDQSGITNMLTILAYLENKSQEEVNQTWVNKTNYKELKTHLIHIINKTLIDLNQKLSKVSDVDIFEHLKLKEAMMNQIANHKLHKVQQLLGLRK